MSQFSELKITHKGQALIAKIIAGEIISKNVKFTKIVTSSHDYQLEELETLTELLDIQQSNANPKTTRLNEVTVKVETAFSNTDLKTGYNIRVLGLFAQDSDESEFLYAVAKEISGNCYMPPYNGATVSGAYIQLITTVGNADFVNFEVNPGAVATIGDIQDVQNQIDKIESFIGKYYTGEVVCNYNFGSNGKLNLSGMPEEYSEDKYLVTAAPKTAADMALWRTHGVYLQSIENSGATDWTLRFDYVGNELGSGVDFRLNVSIAVQRMEAGA